MSQALQARTQKSTETRNHAVDMSGSLEDDEILIGTPVVTPSPAGANLSNKQVSTSTRKINGKRVRAGQAILFTCAGAPGGYTISILCGTNSNPAETVEGTLPLTIT